MTDIEIMLKDTIQLEKWDDGVITMQCAKQGGSYLHFEFATLDEMIPFIRDLVTEVKENMQIMYRPIQEPMDEHIQERCDILLAIQVNQAAITLILDTIDKYYPERKWNKQLLADIDGALSKVTDNG
jgi:hypothetical protein